MSKEFTMRVDGLKELSEVLDMFPQRMQRRLITTAMRQASKPMIATAKSNAVRTNTPSSGALADSIGMVARRNIRGGNRILIGPLRKNQKALLKYLAFYGKALSGKSATSGIRHGHLVEFGHRAANGTHVPGRPFLRPAFDSESAGFTNRFRESLASAIDRAVKQLNKKAEKARLS